MANILQLLGAVGKGVEGYGIDRENRVRSALARSRDDRDAENDRIRNLFTLAQTDALRAPKALPKPERQVVNGQVVDVDAATAKPITGYVAPAKEPKEPKAVNLITAPDPSDPGRHIRVPDVAGQQVPSPSGGGLGGAALKKAIADNRSQIAQIDAAITELDANKQSVGLKRGLGALPGMAKIGEMVNQRVDPKGQTARDKMGAVSSITIKDISGAAVSGPEWQRLGWVPDAAYDYDSNRKKLQSMRELAETKTREMEAAMQGTSGRNAPSGGKRLSPEQYARVKQHYTDAELRAQGYEVP